MPQVHKTHEALVADWQENAEDHDDQNYHFLRNLKMRGREGRAAAVLTYKKRWNKTAFAVANRSCRKLGISGWSFLTTAPRSPKKKKSDG